MLFVLATAPEQYLLFSVFEQLKVMAHTNIHLELLNILQFHWDAGE